MSSGARVQSIDALERFRAALAVFREEAGVALGEVSAELTRFVDWLEHDQLDYWKHELRRREDLVVEARLDLSRCLSATLDPERTPSCHDEKKRLQRAKERVAAAEGRLTAVRSWIAQFRLAVTEYRGRTEALSTALESELPVASAQLERLVARLADYLSVSLAPTPTLEGGAAPAIYAASAAPSGPQILPAESSPSENQASLDTQPPAPSSHDRR